MNGRAFQTADASQTPEWLASKVLLVVASNDGAMPGAHLVSDARTLNSRKHGVGFQ